MITNKKTIVYYTDSLVEEELDQSVRKQILKAAGGIPIISVSQRPINSENCQFGYNIVVGYKPRCYLSLYEQLLVGLEAADDDAIICTCEHDVFYHSSHFDFIPERTDSIYFNTNRFYWMKNEDGFVPAVGKRALSQGVGYKNVFLSHVKEQVDLRANGSDSTCVGPFLNFNSEFPNIDIKHGGNFSKSDKFSKANKHKKIPLVDGWGTVGMFQKVVGYNDNDMKAAEYLHETFNSGDNQNPVTIPLFTRSSLPVLFSSLEFKKGVEIGVKTGMFSQEMFARYNGDLHLKCVDSWCPEPNVAWDEAERRFAIAKEALRDFNAQIIKKSSLQAAMDVPNWSLDFVYIDADHSFDSVMQDIIVWSDRVRPGGIVSGHDYDKEDVKTAVDAYVKIHKCELFVTEKGKQYPDSAPSWFFAKGKQVQ